MTAREKFTAGQRVQLTARALQAHLGKRSAHVGVVVGFGRALTSSVVAVRIDGTKAPSGYHMDYWEPETEAQKAAR